MAKSTPSTAFTHVAPRPSSRWRTGKCFLSPRTSRTGEAIAHEPAPRDAAAGEPEIARLSVHPSKYHLGDVAVDVSTTRDDGEGRRQASDSVPEHMVHVLRH